MTHAEVFVGAAREKGFALWTGVPCSYLKPLINYVLSAEDLRYAAAVNEGDAVALASGASLAGQRSVVMFQNSGLGNAVNPLTSLNYVFKIPVLLIVSLRGEPGGPPDEPQHELMGPVTTDMLDVLRIRWEYFPAEDADVAAALDRAVGAMDQTGLPFAFVMRKDAVFPESLKPLAPTPRIPQPLPLTGLVQRTACVRRGEMLEALRKALRPGDVVLATTGFTGRELYARGDAENFFSMVGSMGCLVSLALGIALVRPDLRVIALDGDGAFLMRMGALAAVGYEKPKNLVHVVFDNESYESTGGQATISRAVDMLCIAAACGYERVEDTVSAEGFADILRRPAAEALTFVRAGILPGVSADLPRPKIKPEEVARRFAGHLQNQRKK
ncbi:MAG: phosphonopyruvate decarboxylase [Spirochaetaceae bacterium]|nr:phosphonopyruvate decarboxylase [Spirochaetaceae bacterium]